MTAVAASLVCTQVTFNWTNPSTPNFGGVFIQRSTTAFPKTSTDGTRVANVLAPGETYTDKHLVSHTKYYYALFAHDTTGQAVSSGVDVSVTPICAVYPGYRMEGGDGGVFDFHEHFYGSIPADGLHIFDFVGLASTEHGYWLVTQTGRVYDFGSVGHFGSLAQSGAAAVDDIVGMATTPNFGGYWLVASNGKVYPFGNAGHFGSLSGVKAVVVGSCTTKGSPCAGETNVVAIASPDTGGYWLATTTGKVTPFGDAHYYGDCTKAGSGCVGLARPIVAMT